MAAVDRPTLDEVAVRLGADPLDARLPAVREAALETQASVCTSGLPYDASMHEAALRRAAFLWGSMPHTLGVLDTGTDLGAQYLPMYHPDWDMLEAPHRSIVVA